MPVDEDTGADQRLEADVAPPELVDARADADVASRGCVAPRILPDLGQPAQKQIPDFVDVDVVVDSGPRDNVFTAVDAPWHNIHDSPGSVRGQQFNGLVVT